MEAIMINKEDIKDKVRFPQGDVLINPEEVKERRLKLDRAMRLGNGYKGKIRIVFATEEGDRVVETTVWATTDSMVQLKGDVQIPIASIKEVVI